MQEKYATTEKRRATFAFKALVFFSLIVISSFFTKQADASLTFIEIHPTISSTGYVTTPCPWGSGDIYGYKGFSGLPFTGTTLVTGNGDIVCSVLPNGTYAMESNFLGGTKPAGNYYVYLTHSGTAYNPDWINGTMYYFTATKNGTGTWGNYIPPTCDDGILNQDETAIDSGGACRTHIVNFTPLESNTPISSPVTFTLDIQVDPADMGGILTITVNLHNIDQNVLLLSDFSPSDILLLDNYVIDEPGPFQFISDPEILADGNYRIDVTIERSYLNGWIINPFSSLNDEQSHSFVVGAPTFIGNMTNNIFSQVNTITGAIGGTKTASELAGSCVPSVDFDVITCMHFLFIPDTKALNDTMTSAKDAILTRVPWGYVTRLVNIIANPTEGALPTFSTKFKTSATDTLTMSFDPGDMLAGAGALVDSIHDPLDETVTFRGTFENMVKLVISIAVLLTIIMDLTGSHKHMAESEAKTKLS
jgi:hypothetical protein